MSCPEEYKTDAKDLNIYLGTCLKNVPEFIKIPPHQVHNTFLQLTSEKNLSQLHGTSFRIAFNFVTANDIDEMFKKNHETIVSFQPKVNIRLLLDTSYNIAFHFIKASYDNGLISQFDRLEKVNLLWSNTMKIK
jgi:hypothetical protein